MNGVIKIENGLGVEWHARGGQGRAPAGCFRDNQKFLPESIEVKQDKDHWHAVSNTLHHHEGFPASDPKHSRAQFSFFTATDEVIVDFGEATLGNVERLGEATHVDYTSLDARPTRGARLSAVLCVSSRTSSRSKYSA